MFKSFSLFFVPLLFLMLMYLVLFLLVSLMCYVPTWVPPVAAQAPGVFLACYCQGSVRGPSGGPTGQGISTSSKKLLGGGHRY